MSKKIDISTDLFAAIWAKRITGEETENQILERILEVNKGNWDSLNPVRVDLSGLENLAGGRQEKYGFFPHGFVATRTYKRQRFEARVNNGSWLRIDTGEEFSSLNQLNLSIVDGTENAWLSWKDKLTNKRLKS